MSGRPINLRIVAALVATFVSAVTTLTAAGTERPAVQHRSRPASADRQPLIYVANSGGGHNDSGSIEAFALHADGDVPPVAVLSGPQTGIANPNNVAADPSGDLFTLISRPGGKAEIAVFGRGSTGDALPVRVIENGRRDHVMVLLCADTAGYVYALYRDGPHLEGHGIDVFPPGASGTVMPVRTITGNKTLMSRRESIVELFVDLRGNIWWYSNGEVGPPRIVEYSAGANGNVVPARVIKKRSFPQTPTSFVVDAHGTIYAGAALEVYVYPPDATGVVHPQRRLQPDCLPYCNVADIAGRDLVFVGMLFEKTAAIATYDALGTGHLRPLRRISGSRTGMVNPVWLASTP